MTTSGLLVREWDDDGDDDDDDYDLCYCCLLVSMAAVVDAVVVVVGEMFGSLLRVDVRDRCSLSRLNLNSLRFGYCCWAEMMF